MKVKTKVKTSELTGAALDWAVCRAQNPDACMSRTHVWLPAGDALESLQLQLDYRQDRLDKVTNLAKELRAEVERLKGCLKESDNKCVEFERKLYRCRYELEDERGNIQDCVSWLEQSPKPAERNVTFQIKRAIKAEDERDTLKAELERLKSQGPVAWMVYAKDSRRYFTLTFDVNKVPEIYLGGEALPLFHAAGAAPTKEQI